MNYIECAFVNGNPIKYGKVLGYHVERKNAQEFVLSVVQEVFYEHPETDRAMLVVNEHRTVLEAAQGHTQYEKLHMLYLMQEICKDIAIINFVK